MTRIYIDGQEVFSKSGTTIKVVKNNPFLTKSGTATYDISLPLSVAENRQVFGHLDRIDVAKRSRSFNDCVVIVDNTVVVRGTGVLTSITNEEVKVQIVSGYSETRYKQDMEGLFIDRLDYPDIAEDYRRGSVLTKQYSLADFQRLFPGVKGKYGFWTIGSTDDTEENQRYLNIFYYNTRPRTSPQTPVVSFENPSLQVGLVYAVELVLKALGYNVVLNDYDRNPYNRIMIANPRRTQKIGRALPHWKVTTFLDQFCNLMNATLSFGDNRDVSIVSNLRINDASTGEYEVADEFTSEYSEEGISYILTNNIKYDLDNTDMAMPEDVFKVFDVVEYDTYNDLITATDGMTGAQKRQILAYLRSRRRYVYYARVLDATGSVTGYVWAAAGPFTMLYRGESEQTTELRMVPVTLDSRVLYASGTSELMPCVEISSDTPEWMGGSATISQGDRGAEDVIGVEDVIDGVSVDKDEESDENIQLYFGTSSMSSIRISSGNDYPCFFVPLCGTSATYGLRADDGIVGDFSLYLHTEEYQYVSSIGDLHDVSEVSAMIPETHHEMVFQFLSDRIPDPRQIFVFRNKRFLCSKVEAEIKDDRLSRLMTGYFHEIK